MPTAETYMDVYHRIIENEALHDGASWSQVVGDV